MEKLVVELEVLERDDRSVQVMAVCLRSSNIIILLHEVHIRIKDEDGKSFKGIYSCYSGSGRCKHVTTVCLQLMLAIKYQRYAWLKDG